MDVSTTLNTYAELMASIKYRHELLISILADRHSLPTWASIEFAQLQVRLITETFALGCLVAHGDIEGARTVRLASAYQADFIVNALEKLHPNFYPRPVRQVVKNGKVVELIDIKEGFLTKAELLTMYRTTAGALHVGDLKDVLSRKQKFLEPMTIVNWANKLLALLNTHQIYLTDSPEMAKLAPAPLGPDGVPMPKRQLAVVMHPPDGTPTVHIFERVDPESAHPSQPITRPES